MGSTFNVEEEKREYAKYVHTLEHLRVRLRNSTKGGIVVTNGAESSLLSEVKENQDQDPIHHKKVLDFEQGGAGVLKYQGRLCVPKVDGLQVRILEGAYSSRYSIHPVPPRCTTI